MNNVIPMSRADYFNLSKIKKFSIVKLDDNKFWIKSKQFTQDYGPFDFAVQAHGWLNLYLKEVKYRKV